MQPFQRFLTASPVIALLALSSPLWSAERTVMGTFKGNGQDAKIAYVYASKGEPFAGADTTMVVFTEKDPGTETKSDIKAVFGEYGSALVITINKEGVVIGCEVAHSAHAQKPFSSIGKIRLENYKNENGIVQGRLTTDGEGESFGQKWLADLTFKAKKI